MISLFEDIFAGICFIFTMTMKNYGDTKWFFGDP